MKNVKKGDVAKILIGIGLVWFVACGFTSCSRDGNDGSNDHSNNGTVLPPDNPNGDPDDPSQVLASGDADGDGVWDYIQPHIVVHPSEKTRIVLGEYAKSVQVALLDADNEELSVQHARNRSYVNACIRYLYGVDEGAKIRDTLLAEILNTDERSRAYFKHDSQLNGYTFTVPVSEASSCKSAGIDDIDSLSN